MKQQLSKMDSTIHIFLPDQLEIPEWKQCYYDYQTLHEMIYFLKKTQTLYSRIKKQLISNNLNNDRSSLSTQSLSRAKLRLRKIILEWNSLFYQYSDKETKIIYLFVQLKLFEIKGKFKIYKKLMKILPRNDERILLLLENLYVQGYYTYNAVYYNISREKMMIKNYNQEICAYSQFNHELRPNIRLIRMKQEMYALLYQIERSYMIESDSWHNKAQKRIKYLGESRATIGFTSTIVIGILMGILVMIGVFIGMFLYLNQINLQTNQTFKEKFPVWRGASYILLYLWLLGLNVLFYETSQINYKLIFRFSGHNLPHAKSIFKSACALTILYLLLLLLFIYQLKGTLKISFVYYGEIFWIILLTYIFLPIPYINFKGTVYFVSLILRVIASPCIPITFLIIWISEQFVSFNQPFGDLFYTICDFITKDGTECRNLTPNFSSAYIIVMLLYRIIQNLKFWYQNTMASPSKQFNFMAPPFLGFIRGFFGLNTAIAALVYRLQLFQNAFTYWLVLSIITTLVSWIVDLKGDWGLLGYEHKFLRQKLLFPRYRILYYIIAVVNLAFRTAWVLSISPFVVKSIGFLPYIFIMIVSYIEIIRRAIWNILRIEFEHIKNCNEFRATINDEKILKAVQESAVEIKRNRIDKIRGKQSDRKINHASVAPSTMVISPEFEEMESRILAQIKQITEINQLQDTRLKKQTVLFKQLLQSRRQLKQIIVEREQVLEKQRKDIYYKNESYIQFQESEGQSNRSESDDHRSSIQDQ